MNESAEAISDHVQVPRTQSAAASFSVPNLVFDNHTQLDALQFDTVDQHGAAFHVVVAKASFSIGRPDGSGFAELALIPGGASLSPQDKFIDDLPMAGVLIESDFAPFKPACDVIVNAKGYAPGGKAVTRFPVRLTVERPADERPGKAPEPLVDKTLVVSGAREFRKKRFLWRMVDFCFTVGSLGLIRPVPWRLTSPDVFTELPLQYTETYGGECKIAPDDPDAKRLPRPMRQRAKAQPPGTPLAHEACLSNPLGRGFARLWYLSAKQVNRMPAPRITYPAAPCTARGFWSAAKGGDLPQPAGIGTLGRAWMPRRALAGTFEAKAEWAQDEIPRLPSNFDFAYWNCAPRDQQCAYLNDQAQFTLLNLCRPDHPSSIPAVGGGRLLRFRLPRQAVFLLTADHENKVSVERLVVDTVVVYPDTSRIDLVWRGCIPADGEAVEARLMHVTETEQLKRLHELEQVQEALAEQPPVSGTNSPSANDGQN